jgi:hypothetical protein
MLTETTHDPVWYLAYGSNLQHARFACYLSGGRPVGARRTYAGCRDTSMPRRWQPMTVPGRLVFAGESPVWGGGVALYDPEGSGEVAGRAYLLTRGQLSDVVAQETRQDPGIDRDLAGGLTGGTGLYDAVVGLAAVEDVPVFTLASRRRHRATAPSPAYLRRVVHGLVETFAWDAERCADYLSAAAGVGPAWTRQALCSLHPHALRGEHADPGTGRDLRT